MVKRCDWGEWERMCDWGERERVVYIVYVGRQSMACVKVNLVRVVSVRYT